jgi:dihydroorotase
MIARDIVLAQTLGTKIHIAHISTKGSVQLIREAKARGVAVTCETCPHYFCLTDDGVLSYDTNFKVNPPLREKGDVEAIIGGIKDGTVDAIVTDHAPHHTDDKNVEFAKASSGISGLETLFCLCYTALVKSGAITLNKLSQLLTKNPKKILGLEDGGIKAGFAADLTIVDINKKHRISKLGFVSKGKNTPFDGAEVFGEVRYTIVDGVIKYKT